VSNTTSTSSSSLTEAGDAVGVATSTLLGGPIAGAVTAIQDTSIATASLSGGQIVGIVFFWGFAVVAGSVAYATYRYDRPNRPRGLPLKRATEGTYSGTPYEIQPYRDEDGKTVWWIHVHVAHKEHVEGLPSYKAAVTRVRRVVDYYRTA
jgi:hypothetical protein